MDFSGFITPVQQIEAPLLREKEITLLVKRDDLIHPEVQGNKWRKLKYNLTEAEKTGHRTLLTFGGYYSNHIAATAAAAKISGFPSIGVIRGEEPPKMGATLRYASEQGMTLHFVSRSDYDRKEQADFIQQLHNIYGEFYLIPEGGTNLHALRGVEEIIGELPTGFDVLCTPVGTGGTLAGLVASLKGEKQVIGFSSLKGSDTLTAKVNELLQSYTGNSFSNFSISFDYHFGGYAKTNPELMDFIQEFQSLHGIPLEPVYTGKMFYGLLDWIRKDYFQPRTVIMAVHTGGLQGWGGFVEKLS